MINLHYFEVYIFILIVQIIIIHQSNLKLKFSVFLITPSFDHFSGKLGYTGGRGSGSKTSKKNNSENLKYF